MTTTSSVVRLASLALLLGTVPACGGEQQAYDWRNREIPWSYGPTKGTAAPEHLIGTGTKGGAKIAEGWIIRLVDGDKLTVKPYKLAESHELFGEVGMTVGMFDKSGEIMESVTSDVITSNGASFSFDVREDVAKSIWDVVVWFKKKD